MEVKGSTVSRYRIVEVSQDHMKTGRPDSHGTTESYEVRDGALLVAEFGSEAEAIEFVGEHEHSGGKLVRIK